MDASEETLSTTTESAGALTSEGTILHGTEEEKAADQLAAEGTATESGHLREMVASLLAQNKELMQQNRTLMGTVAGREQACDPTGRTTSEGPLKDVGVAVNPLKEDYAAWREDLLHSLAAMRRGAYRRQLEAELLCC